MNRFLSSLASRTHRMTNVSFVRWNSFDRFPGIAKLVEENKLHYLRIPELMDDKNAAIKKWLLKEGDSFRSGDPICELAYPSMTIEYSADVGGIIAEMLANEGQHVDVEKPFIAYAANQDEYNAYFDSKREALMDEARFQAAQESLEHAKKSESEAEKVSSAVTPMVMLRHIKHLIQKKEIDAESDFAKKLQALARAGDKSITEIFEASFDGISFNEDTFDNKFFLENAKAIVNSSS